MMQVLHYAALTPMRIRALLPEHLALDQARVRMPSRNEGTGTAPTWQPLTQHGVETLKEFAAMGAWGGEHRDNLIRVFRRAAKRVRPAHPDAFLPDEASPCWLKHPIATTKLKATKDKFQTAAYLAVDPRTLDRYTGVAVADIQRHVAATLEQALRVAQATS